MYFYNFVCVSSFNRIDATYSDAMCKYVNDDTTGNFKMKKIKQNQMDHLCLFATKPIHKDDELRYNYIRDGNDRDLYWRKVSVKCA